MIWRREILKSAAFLVPGRALTGGPTEGVRLGCQINAWPVDGSNFGRLLAVVTNIKNYGYDGFETAFANVQGQFDRPAEAKAKLEAVGIGFLEFTFSSCSTIHRLRLRPARFTSASHPAAQSWVRSG